MSRNKCCVPGCQVAKDDVPEQERASENLPTTSTVQSNAVRVGAVPVTRQQLHPTIMGCEMNEDEQQPGPSGGARRRNVRTNNNPGQWRNRSGSRDLQPRHQPWRAPARSRSPMRGQGLHQLSRGRMPRGVRNSNYNDRRNDNNSVHRQNIHGNTPNQNRAFVGFRTLEEIARSDSKEILVKINEKSNGFHNLVDSPIERYDVFVLTMKIIAKVCESNFNELKLKILLKFCQSQFLNNLRVYLMDLPYTTSKTANILYWDNQMDFWQNFTTFCDCIVNLCPSIALQNCRSLIEAASKLCLDLLSERHGFNLPEENSLKLTELRDKLKILEAEAEQPINKRKIAYILEQGEPSESFRQLSIVPTPDDMLEIKPFLRPNIVEGAYQDTEHYLDVQFRLLREDCFGPLREGIIQYKNDPDKNKYDNIRVFRNVKFVEPYISQTKVGCLVQIDVNANRTMRRINWAHSKRFIYGSLVLFTQDNCRTFIVGTILDRDVRHLSEGKIPVSIIDREFDEEIYTDIQPYVMIESEIYFEPYIHVLKALSDPQFPDHLAMQKYIVKVDPLPKHPSYLDAEKEFIILDHEMSNLVTDENNDMDEDYYEILFSQASELSHKKFKVLQADTWPSKAELKLNSSQFEAFQLALTHEFAVIQGPPGTGKTYLGVKVAKTLLQNLSSLKGCIMLIICYTNHALDQFLEAIMHVTKSIVRIGGQSRNDAMKDINLTNLRKAHTSNAAQKLYTAEKYNLKDAISEFRTCLSELDVYNNGIINGSCIAGDSPDVQRLGQFYNKMGDLGGQDALKYWLFEHSYMYPVDFEQCLLDDYSDVATNPDDDRLKRTQVVIDDVENEDNPQSDISTTLASFTLSEARATLKRLVSHYKGAPLNNKNYLKYEIEKIASQVNMYSEMATHRTQQARVRINNATNFSRIETIDRWILYFNWIRPYMNRVIAAAAHLQENVLKASAAYEEARTVMDVQLLANTKVIGMTTSGAARMRNLLTTLAPPIVIVEEAAEVLEQHIITSLTKDCKHLILIGDHQQLRPSASHMKLARHYGIEVSLFERMIKNGIHSRRLGVQHRMRPEIAALISPHIYPDLENHPDVHTFPDVLGLTKNLFFFTHDHKEQKIDDNASRSNHSEADMVLATANYIMQQGYASEDVTILTGYSGQMFYMKKERANYIHLAEVKITLVDNYQGEESKIILLSLVRNNDQNKIGFLGIENRICVALSRAREGLYIFGNIDILKTNSELWRNITITLESNNSLGSAFNLKCQNHPEQTTAVSNPEDFQKVPEGGCLSKCNFAYKCGHVCSYLCHAYDRNHITNWTKCRVKCERVLCDLGHGCPLLCSDACPPCKQLIKKTLPCGHEANIYCHLDPDDTSIKCETEVTVTLPDCGHQEKKACYVKIKSVLCTTRCEYRVEKCGHACRRNCHVNDDPDHEKYLCFKPCAKANNGCTANLEGDLGDHQCLKKCYETCDDCKVQVVKRRSSCKHLERTLCHEDIDAIPCGKKCARALDCQHYCKKKCSEKCGECNQMVVKPVPGCGHTVKIECNKEATREHCKAMCTRTLVCGHPCNRRCAEPCDPTLCTAPSSTRVKAACEHYVTLPCCVSTSPNSEVEPMKLLKFCTEPCNVELGCGHVCSGTCSGCHQGRLHQPCAQTCQQPNICGHQCEEPCNQVCPPCSKRCEVKCAHSTCGRQCGAPCVPCKEKCNRNCPHHGRCIRRCDEPCSRVACEERCPKQLPCGHACRGLCGEPCPDICSICRPDTFPTDFLGDAYTDNDIFIQLQDCNHVLEVADMDNLMTGDTETVSIRKCPFCRKPIINTNRYKHIVNDTIKKQLGPIKEKVYGSVVQIKDSMIALRERIKLFASKHAIVLRKNNILNLKFKELLAVSTKNAKSSLLYLEVQTIFLSIMEMIAESCEKYYVDNCQELKLEVETQINMICSVLIVKKKKVPVVIKISQQQQQDANNELKRLNSIMHLCRIFNNPLYKSSKNNEAVAKAAANAKAAVLNVSIFAEQSAIDSLKLLGESVKVTGVTKQERDLIVKAIGLKAGHWYKCPNGHFYCIADCGGAMVVSKCIECGESVGGTSHTLLRSNAHAPEIDGSKFPAWSEQYNNMANFNLE